MVKLTQIDDEANAAFKAAPGTTVPKTETYSDSESDSESDIDDDFDYENETVYDRIVALKDIIAPEQRVKIISFTENLKSYANSALNRGGSLLWGLTSSALLLGVPLSLAILAESQLQEMENQLSLQPGAQDVLASGVDATEKKPEA